ncbi:MAG: pyridoxal-dependent decarboxylase [Pseudomonadota bacterium]|nr:pyridoxal-dependent decarboxylase [Pseudomonadota bacterium]
MTVELTPEEMRALGYRVVDTIVDHLATLKDKPATGQSDWDSLEAALAGPPPEHGAPPDQVMDLLERELLPHVMYTNHPRFFAFVPGPSNFAGVMADALASGLNVIACDWLEATAATVIEHATVDWIRQFSGFPESAGGLFTSGGSVANLTALAVARRVKLDGDMTKAVTYCSDQTHGSNQMALRVLGFRDEQLRKVATDDHLRMDVAVLTAAIASDRAAGLRPFCVIANAGTPNTGAADPLDAIADLCTAEDLWFHIDGAYGAPAVLTERGASALKGLGRAHSLAIDPHKWLFQPFEIGCVLVREAHWMPATFSLEQEYMQDATVAGREINYADYGIQLTRSFRALKLWMTIKVHGMAAIRAGIDHGLDLAEHAERLLTDHPDFDVVTPASLAVVSFAYRCDDPARVHGAMIEALVEDGHAMVTSTLLGDRSVLRLCTINPRTAFADIDSTLTLLAELSAQAATSNG